MILSISVIQKSSLQRIHVTNAEIKMLKIKKERFLFIISHLYIYIWIQNEYTYDHY